MLTNAAFTELRQLLDSNKPEKAKEVLFSLQAGYFSLLDEIDHLHLRITSFEDLLALSKAVSKEDGLIWFTPSRSKTKIGPFCPLCYSADKSLIRMAEERASEGAKDWVCPSCRARYPGPGRKKAILLPFSKPGWNQQ